MSPKGENNDNYGNNDYDNNSINNNDNDENLGGVEERFVSVSNIDNQMDRN